MISVAAGLKWGLRHWREMAILAVVLTAVGMCRARDAAIAHAAAAAVRDSVVQDSLRRELDANSLRLAATDSALQEASLRVDLLAGALQAAVRQHEVDTLWRRDTIRLGGELRVAVPPATIARTDATIASCGILISECQSERLTAAAKYATCEDRVRLLERSPHPQNVVPPAVGWKARLAWAAVGAAAGYVGGRADERRRRPP